MVGPVFLLLMAAEPAAAVPQAPTAASIRIAPETRALFERDWVLMNWALKFYDRDHDVLLSEGEAQTAAGEFRRIADANGDGRVSTDEYGAARALILSRYLNKEERS